MSDILCVTNRKLCKESFTERIKRVAAAHPAGIILREKDLTASEYKGLAMDVLDICKRENVKCILHTFADVALELECPNIHLPLPILRELSEEKKAGFTEIGASCHSVEDAIEAQKLGCTYITAGHVFETDCKKGLPGRGHKFLQEVCNAVKIPVYGIGGISADNINEVRKDGAKGACLMSSLMVCPDVSELLKTMEKTNEI